MPHPRTSLLWSSSICPRDCATWALLPQPPPPLPTSFLPPTDTRWLSESRWMWMSLPSQQSPFPILSLISTPCITEPWLAAWKNTAPVNLLDSLRTAEEEDLQAAPQLSCCSQDCSQSTYHKLLSSVQQFQLSHSSGACYPCVHPDLTRGFLRTPCSKSWASGSALGIWV